MESCNIINILITVPYTTSIIMATLDILQTRIQKAKILFQPPHFLLLQVEKTFSSLEEVKIWLQNYVFSQGFALVV